MCSVKQVITRVDDNLHAELKARAAERGVSVNAFVTDVLVGVLGRPDRRAAVRRRARAAGRLVVPDAGSTPSRAGALAAARGTGDAVSSALAAERADG